MAKGKKSFYQPEPITWPVLVPDDVAELPRGAPPSYVPRQGDLSLGESLPPAPADEKANVLREYLLNKFNSQPKDDGEQQIASLKDAMGDVGGRAGRGYQRVSELLGAPKMTPPEIGAQRHLKEYLAKRAEEKTADSGQLEAAKGLYGIQKGEEEQTFAQKKLDVEDARARLKMQLEDKIKQREEAQRGKERGEDRFTRQTQFDTEMDYKNKALVAQKEAAKNKSADIDERAANRLDLAKTQAELSAAKSDRPPAEVFKEMRENDQLGQKVTRIYRALHAAGTGDTTNLPSGLLAPQIQRIAVALNVNDPNGEQWRQQLQDAIITEIFGKGGKNLTKTEKEAVEGTMPQLGNDKATFLAGMQGWIDRLRGDRATVLDTYSSYYDVSPWKGKDPYAGLPTQVDPETQAYWKTVYEKNATAPSAVGALRKQIRAKSPPVAPAAAPTTPPTQAKTLTPFQQFALKKRETVQDITNDEIKAAWNEGER